MNLWLSLIIFLLPIFFFGYVHFMLFPGKIMVGKELGEIVPFFVLGFVSSLAIHYFIISDLQLFFSIIQ
ncbi:MAG: hypothetical protein SAK42_21655, partial [Oscillatoria sp. PMC 1076.18]|nr:hypothetical protein [Oscillatoria sp. PMC 1076.18]